MANLARRCAKSGSRWGMNELIAFNIKVKAVDAPTFFGNAVLPQPMVLSVILDNLEEPVGPLLQSDIHFFGYMANAMIISPNKKSNVDGFVAFVLKMMHYDEGCRLIHMRTKMGFEMCGQYVNAKADVCVVEPPTTSSNYLLLVQEDKVC
jgi:hypothetical protein